VFKILPVHPKVLKLIQKYNLRTKFEKQINLLAKDPRHPSLNLELLEPKKMGIYSFRIDRKFRAFLIFRPDKNSLEIINITVHYR